MKLPETRFEAALRRAHENEGRIARQHALIAQLERQRQTGLLVEAHRFLDAMESNRRLYSATLRTVFDEPG